MGETRQKSRKRIGTFTGIVIAMLVPFAIGLLFLEPSSEGTLGVLGAGWLWLVVSFILYFLPTLVADSRDVEGAGGVFAINFLVGWTFVGWLVALVMAFTKPKKGARDAEIEAAVSAALEAQRRDSL